MFSMAIQAEASACPADGWRPAYTHSSTIYMRESRQEVEMIGIFESSKGEYGIAHGRVMFNAPVESVYKCCIAQDTFEQEHYWRHCLLPQRFGSTGEALKLLQRLICKKEENHYEHTV